MNYTQRHCPTCNQYVLAWENVQPHFAYGILTFFTCGLFLPVWIVLAFLPARHRCMNCGTSV